MAQIAERRIAPGEIPCPTGGVHDLKRQERPRPGDSTQTQDRMACTQCGGVLYPWRTIRRTREKA